MADMSELKSLLVQGNETIAEVQKKNAELEARLAEVETKANRPGGSFAIQSSEPGLIGAEVKKLIQFFETGEGLDRKGITSTGTGAAGGFALPEVIDTTIMDQLRSISPIRQIARVVSVTSSDYKALVGLGGVATVWNAETTDRSAETASPTMAEVAPTHGELWAKPEISQWALDDLIIGPENWLQTNVTDTFAQAEGTAFVSGDGTNKPTGFLAGPTPVVTADAGRAFGAATASVSPADCLINMIYTLKAGYRVNGRWVMNSQTAGTVRKFKDLEGRFLWTDPLAEGQPALLLGYPVTIAEDMPDIGANTFPIAFGDFQRGYIIADRVGIRIIRDEVTKPGFVRYLIGKRVAGKLLDTNAIKLLKMAAT
jgi:HK97 family phage major capsid protein